MASDFKKLNQEQQAWAEKVTQFGINKGYSPDVTKAAMMLLHQESDFGRYDKNLGGSGATGPFQFLGAEHIKDELVGYRTNHPVMPTGAPLRYSKVVMPQ